jgi:NAD(P) transhydrogenase subunit alpha
MKLSDVRRIGKDAMVKAGMPEATCIVNPHSVGVEHGDNPMRDDLPFDMVDDITLQENMVITADLASRLATQASTLYSNNLLRLTEEPCKAKDGMVVVNMEDDAIRGLTVIKDGTITWPAPPLKLPAPPAQKPAAAMPAKPKGHGHGEPSGPMPAAKTAVIFGVAALLFLLVGRYAPQSFLGHFTVFVLACFIGYMVVWNVKPALHTPLMSVTNAVSSIIAIGALVQIAPDLTKISTDLSRPHEWIRWLSVGAIALATINMFGGFAVTQRMLQMFRK